MPFSRTSIGSASAKELGRTRWWEGKAAREIARFQLFTAEMCCPLDVLLKAVEESLGRPVWISDLVHDLDGICTEFLGRDGAPTAEEVAGFVARVKIAEAVPQADDVQSGAKIEKLADHFGLQNVEAAVLLFVREKRAYG
jgi:hypothetical protein